jgi:hypothetical protein
MPRPPAKKLLYGLPALLLLAACGSETDPGPGGVSAGDAKALDDAAKKLDERDSAVAKPAVEQ